MEKQNPNMLLFVLVNISPLEGHNARLMGPRFESAPLLGCLMRVTEEEEGGSLDRCHSQSLHQASVCAH